MDSLVGTGDVQRARTQDTDLLMTPCPEPRDFHSPSLPPSSPLAPNPGSGVHTGDGSSVTLNISRSKVSPGSRKMKSSRVLIFRDLNPEFYCSCYLLRRRLKI